MNKFYRYPNIELWDSSFWKGRLGAADPLLQWIQSHNDPRDGGFEPPICDDPTLLPTYRRKTKCVDLPEILQEWEEKGLKCSTLEQGQKLWISAVPMNRLEKKRLPVLVVQAHQDYADPWWAMKTMTSQRPVLEMAAKAQNFILVFLVTQGCDIDRIYSGILQEAIVLYHCDADRVYLDVSVPLRKGMLLKKVPDLRWVDRRGKEIDPDEAVEFFGERKIPVLDISGRWGTRDSLNRGLVMDYVMNEGTFDRDRYIHSMMGKHTMEGITLEYRYDTDMDAELCAYWRNMGLDVAEQETEGERWLVLAPRETQGRLPVMVVMQEVDRGNEHLAVTAFASFHTMAEIAAQGECILLFFALEHPDTNDLLVKILPEAAKKFPVDLSRVYITGHSHNGYFALHFAIRNPGLIAGVATLGNPMALEPPAERGEPILAYSDEQIEALSKVDMPLINLAGYCERSGHVPRNSEEYRRWIRNVQRRLKAMRCPVKTEEEIRSVRGCDDLAQRKIGIPADHSETVWADGVEHYIVDIRNMDGKNHLRLVSSENMPHMTTPYMQEMAWSFLRRFARNLKTGETIERY